MKDFFKAYKLYMKASFSGIVVACATAVFMMTLLTLMMTMISGISPSDYKYTAMLGKIDMGYVIHISWFMMGKTTITTSKFFIISKQFIRQLKRTGKLVLSTTSTISMEILFLEVQNLT